MQDDSSANLRAFWGADNRVSPFDADMKSLLRIDHATQQGPRGVQLGDHAAAANLWEAGNQLESMEINTRAQAGPDGGDSSMYLRYHGQGTAAFASSTGYDISPGLEAIAAL
jgi:hypothetical protein